MQGFSLPHLAVVFVIGKDYKMCDASKSLDCFEGSVVL